MSDLSPRDHFETQAVCQKYTDGAVSKTVNLPSGTSPEQLSGYLLEYIRDLKGCAIYVDGTRGNQVYNKLTEVQVATRKSYMSQTEVNALYAGLQTAYVALKERSAS